MGKDIIKAITVLPHIGIIMFVPIFGCIVAGHYLDTLLDTNMIFLIIFIILGVGAAFRSLYVFCMRTAKQDEKENKNKKNINIKKIRGKN